MSEKGKWNNKKKLNSIKFVLFNQIYLKTDILAIIIKLVIQLVNIIIKIIIVVIKTVIIVCYFCFILI